jgi:hypothetical protein
MTTQTAKASRAKAKGEGIMSQRSLMPMDVVTHDDRLWTVSTAHLSDNEGRQLVNLVGYNWCGYKESVPAYACKIIEDYYNRKSVELMPGLEFYPETDFKRKDGK